MARPRSLPRLTAGLLSRQSRATCTGGASGISDWMPGSSPGMSQCLWHDFAFFLGSLPGSIPAVQCDMHRQSEWHLRLDARDKARA